MRLQVRAFAAVASTLMLAATTALSQQAGTVQTPPQKEQSMPMNPRMQMDHSQHTEPASSKPITEPTVAPSEDADAMHMHMHKIDHVMPHLPEIGVSKNPKPEAGPIYSLEDLEQRALSHNPTLSQATQDIAAARGVRRQVGLNPNPTVGYYGDEIRGGVYRSGKEGFFVDQPVILGGKLGLNRKIEDQSIHEAEAAKTAQRYRVRNATRESYYRVLTAQELLATKRGLEDIAHSLTEYTHELSNTGQADPSEVLQTEVEEQHTQITVGVQENTLRRAWTELTSVVGEPSLPMGTVKGDIEALPPEPDESRLLNDLLAHSPAVQYSQAGVAKAEATLKRARRDPFPDLSVKGGVSQDNEPLDTPQSRVGLVGFAEIGLQVHVFDRNQGNIDAARADVERAHQELTRVELSLRNREASVLQNYRDAKLVATRYHDEILPRTRQAYELITTRYGLMEASFSRTLNLQRDLYQSTAEYLEALEETQRQYVILNGFLYSEGLHPAGSADPVNRQSTGAAMASPLGSSGPSMSNSGLSALPWQGGSQ